MQIAKHKVVSIDYTLTDDQGEVIDTSDGKEPLSYIQGTGSIIPGLENALEGKTTGDSLEVTIAPEEGYGEHDESLLVTVPRDRFEDGSEVTVGARFQTPTEHGMRIVTIVKVEQDTVTVDANHPLAGATLNFDVKVLEIRDATSEEID